MKMTTYKKRKAIYDKKIFDKMLEHKYNTRFVVNNLVLEHLKDVDLEEYIKREAAHNISRLVIDKMEFKDTPIDHTSTEYRSTLYMFTGKELLSLIDMVLESGKQ